MKRFLLFLLPCLSLLGILVIFIGDSSITGFVVQERILNADVTLKTEKGNFLPKDAEVIVSFDDKKESMKVKKFIEKTGAKFELNELGYSGDYEYVLRLSEIMDVKLSKGEHILKIEVKYKDKILSYDEKKVIV